jgi:uncharacterized peroxidase-related enzyme
MAHIQIHNPMPGISGLMQDHPEFARPLNALAEALLQKNEGLSMGERELIAAHVSQLNSCTFCCNCHVNASLTHFEAEPRFIDVLKDSVQDGLEIRPVVKALLRIAGKVQENGKKVTPEDVEAARKLGATDDMLHDTVLIAAAFCMYNRYVDGLGTWCPQEVAPYAEIGERLAHRGYVHSVS